jgi:hypothetical protein
MFSSLLNQKRNGSETAGRILRELVGKLSGVTCIAPNSGESLAKAHRRGQPSRSIKLNSDVGTPASVLSSQIRHHRFLDDVV